MTKRSELLWEQAVNDGDYAEARLVGDELYRDDEEASGRISAQRAILSTAAFWGIDYGSLPDGEA